MPQHKYISDLLLKFHLHTCKPVRTPMVVRTALTLLDGELLAEPSQYRSMVDALQYLIVTRPDIAYAVHIVSQFMHAPHITHLHTVKRIIRYLQGSMEIISHVLSYSCCSIF